MTVAVLDMAYIGYMSTSFYITSKNTKQYVIASIFNLQLCWLAQATWAFSRKATKAVKGTLSVPRSLKNQCSNCFVHVIFQHCM